MELTASKTVKIVRTEEQSIEIDEHQLHQMIQAAGIKIPDKAVVRIYFAVPGGGDWSNIDIDIDAKNPIRVEWRLTTEENGHG